MSIRRKNWRTRASTSCVRGAVGALQTDLHLGQKRSILWLMKLRLDLLEHLTAEDIKKAAIESAHRFKPEPNFSKTGIGSLSSASTKERAKEVEHSMALTRKLEAR